MQTSEAWRLAFLALYARSLSHKFHVFIVLLAYSSMFSLLFLCRSAISRTKQAKPSALNALLAISNRQLEQANANRVDLYVTKLENSFIGSLRVISSL